MAAGWDVVGLQLGNSTRSVERVAVCHEVTDDVLSVVETEKPGLVVSYHPLLFSPIRRLVAGNGPSGRAFRLLDAGVALGIVHTAFDVGGGGTADALAEAIGLEDVKGFGMSVATPTVKIVAFVPPNEANAVAESMAAAGAGQVGNYSGCSFRSEGVGGFFAISGSSPTVVVTGKTNEEPEVRLEMIAPLGARDQVIAALVGAHSSERPAFDVYETASNAGFIGRIGSTPTPLSMSQLTELVGSSLHLTSGMRSSSRGGGPVNRVAVLPGSGTSFIDQAIAAGADVFVTGDVAHHHVIESLDRGMAIIDAGHIPTERPGVRRLVDFIEEIEVLDLTDLDPTPWR